MPQKDMSGPFGTGPKTGRGLGLCGCGMRKGIGGCFSRGFSLGCINAHLTNEEQKKILQAQLSQIDFEKQEIEKKLTELSL